MVGAKAGDEVEVKVTFPEDYQATDLAGKAAVFVTKVNEVKAKEVPAFDDELAKDLDDEVETLDELKAKYRKELEAANMMTLLKVLHLIWLLKTLKSLNCQQKWLKTKFTVL